MPIFKKKELSKAKIDELINPDGSPIEGDERYDTTSQINVGVDKAGSGIPATITDKAVHDKQQGNRYYYGPQGITYPGSAFHKAAVDAQSGDDLEFDVDLAENIEEIAKEKMAKMVEDLVTNKSIGNDMVKKSTPSTNNIPDISQLKRDKPSTVNTVIQFIRTINGNGEELNSNEKNLVLNYILTQIESSDASINNNSVKNKL